MTCPHCHEATMIPVSVEQLAFDEFISDHYCAYVCPRCWGGCRD